MSMESTSTDEDLGVRQTAEQPVKNLFLGCAEDQHQESGPGSFFLSHRQAAEKSCPNSIQVEATGISHSSHRSI